MTHIASLLTGIALAVAAAVSWFPSLSAQAPAVSISRVTLAATNVKAMVAFYNGVFGANLRPATIGGVGMQLGTLADLELLLCPNEIAKVDAALNRHMLRIVVDNVDATIERVRANGGTVDAPPALSNGERLVAVRDPDGNTIEVVARQ